jgi:hypothetical protein
MRKQLALPVRLSGLGIGIPTETANHLYDSSVEITKVLSESLLSGGEDFNVQTYLRESRIAKDLWRSESEEARDQEMREMQEAADSGRKRLLERAGKTGSWLTIMPNIMNGTVLSAEEFRDSLRIRYGFVPLDLQPKCDGCGKAFTVGHAMSCKNGGMVLLRHNDVASEWHHLCAQGLSPSAVHDEPLIHTGHDRRGSQTPGEEH